MCAVELLEALLARGVDVCAVDGNDIVSAVGGGIEDRLVLAHKSEGDGGCDTAEGAWVRTDIDEVP